MAKTNDHMPILIAAESVFLTIVMIAAACGAADNSLSPDDFPPQVCSVTYLDDLSDSAAEYFCTGVIIAPDLVLTTADSDTDWGSFYTFVSCAEMSGEKVVRKVWPPDNRVCHPKYIEGSSFHNVAILKVDEPFGIPPIRLAAFDRIERLELSGGRVKHSNDEVVHNSCALFGYTVIEEENEGGAPEVIVKPKGTLIDFWWENPEDLINRRIRRHYGYWSPNILLDGDYSELGDGAPLVCRNPAGEWILTGLVSGTDKELHSKENIRRTMVHCLRQDIEWLRIAVREMSDSAP